VRSHQRMRGKWAKGNFGGHPFTKRGEYLPRLSPVKVLRLRRRGLSLADIAELVHRSRSTVQSILERQNGAVRGAVRIHAK
jgi:hypothetical protein